MEAVMVTVYGHMAIWLKKSLLPSKSLTRQELWEYRE